jgi:serine/threonine-protein kinase RsbW
MRTAVVDELMESLTGAGAPARDCANWREVRLHRVEELAPLLNGVASALVGLDYSLTACLGFRLALQEAVMNGLLHGNQGNPSKYVRVRYRIDSESVLAEIEDEGPGFDPASVPDPTIPENLERPSGRGLFLMRHYTNWLRYNDRGNRLLLCKYRLP